MILEQRLWVNITMLYQHMPTHTHLFTCNKNLCFKRPEGGGGDTFSTPPLSFSRSSLPIWTHPFINSCVSLVWGSQVSDLMQASPSSPCWYIDRPNFPFCTCACVCEHSLCSPSGEITRLCTNQWSCIDVVFYGHLTIKRQ